MGLRAWLRGGFIELAELSHVLSQTIWVTLMSTGIMVMHRHSLHTGGSLSIAATWHELWGGGGPRVARASVVPGVMDVLGKCQILVNWCFSRHDVFHGPSWWGPQCVLQVGFQCVIKILECTDHGGAGRVPAQ